MGERHIFDLYERAKGRTNSLNIVIPAKAGTQTCVHERTISDPLNPLNIVIPAKAEPTTRVRIKTCSERRGGATFFAMRIIVPCVYILASRPNGTLYIGVTSDLPSR